MARDRTYDAALRSAFGRVTDITPSQARDAADVLDQKAADAGPHNRHANLWFERAAQLREWADLGTNNASEDERHEADGQRVIDVSTRKRRKGRKGKIGRSVSDAAGGGEQAIASSIRSAGDLFWVWLTFALGIALLAVAVRNPDRLRAAWEQLADVVARFIDPWSADRASSLMSDTTTNQTARVIRV